MGVFEPKDKSIKINEHEYALTGAIRSKYVDKFPAKINTGGDSYDQEQYLSNWTLNGPFTIGKEEMDESVDAERSWWTDLNTEHKGHMILGRLATAIAAPSWLTLSNTGFETFADSNFTGWTYSETNANFALSQEDTIIDVGTYSAKITDASGIAGAQSAQLLQAAVTWSNTYRGTSITVTVRIHNTDVTKAKGQLIIDDGIGTTTANSAGSGAFETVTCTRVLDASATKCAIICKMLKVTADTASCYFDALTFPTVSTLAHCTEFNSTLYWTYGGLLLKMNAGRTAFTVVGAFPQAITSLVPSLNNTLYIAFGDAYQYVYMSTAEAITATTDAGGLNANWFVQHENYLIKINTSGTCETATTPNSATPTWTATGSITDIASQIETFFIGKDADGNDTLYCATNSWLKALSVPSTGIANAVWVNTAVKLPNHPNGGKGACYWNDGHYLSSGLNVKRYVTGSTASLSDIGIDTDDGLPYEYNGEIVKLLSESGSDVMYALIDASQVTGTSYSGLYGYNGQGWRCLWVDPTADEAMYDCIVSSASSAYAVYWSCGTNIWYINLPRGIQNINQLLYSTNVLHESYTTTADSYQLVTSTATQFVPFTPTETHTIAQVVLPLFRVGTPGTLTVGIYATASGQPTGDALCTGTIDANIFTTDTDGEEKTITFGAGTSLTLSTEYAIKLSASSAPSGSSVGWLCNDTTTSATSPGTMADDASVGTVAWSNPDNAKVSDNVYALNEGNSTSHYTHYLKATNFGFSIPSGATINGIKVEFERHKGIGVSTIATTCRDVRIVKNGVIGAINDSFNPSGDNYPEGTDIYKSYPTSSITDLWGTTWTPEDINSSNFGVAICALIGSLVTTGQFAYVDHIRITVYACNFLFKEYSANTNLPSFATSGTFYTPWFDAGSSAVRKLIKRMRTYSQSITSTETITIYYRTNYGNRDLTNGWTTLLTMNASTYAGEYELNLDSGVGYIVNAIQFKIAFARGDTTSLSPDLNAMINSYRKATKGNWMWTFTIKFDSSKPGSLKEQQDNLDSALESESDVPMIYRRDDTNETHYVKLYELGRSSQTGDFFSGEVTLQAIEM